MPAEVESMFYTSNERNGRFVPWHGLGTPVEEAPTSKKALELSGLDWKVVQHDVKDAFTNAVVPNYRLNVRNTDNSILGIVGNRYKIVQNEDAFDFTDVLIGNGVKYETAGSLFNGKKIWLLARMPVKKLIDDDVDPYIVFTNTHDGSGSIKVAMTPTRVVCNNTLNLALEGSQRIWSTRHVGDINYKLEEARSTLKMASDYMDALSNKANELVSKKISDNDVRRMVDSLFKVDVNSSDRKIANIEDNKYEIYVAMAMPDLANYTGTAWQFINAVADYTSHHKPARNASTYKERNWNNVMSGHNILDSAYAMVNELV